MNIDMMEGDIDGMLQIGLFNITYHELSDGMRVDRSLKSMLLWSALRHAKGSFLTRCNSLT
jgi:hypothetical protein